MVCAQELETGFQVGHGRMSPMKLEEGAAVDCMCLFTDNLNSIGGAMGEN
jgi:hypothetical protein